VAIEGSAPPKLSAATEGHLRLSLRHLGIALAKAAELAPDAEAGARCVFAPPPQHSAQCVVDVVQRTDLQRAERRLEVPYRDAEDLAASLALLVSDLLQSDFPGLVQNPAGRIDALPIDEPPPVDPHAARPRDGAQTDDRSRAGGPGDAGRKGRDRGAGSGDRSGAGSDRRAGSDEAAPRARRSRPRLPPGRIAIEIGPAAVVGFTGEPPLFGAALRAIWAAGPLRVGGTLSVAGIDTQLEGWDLTFTRLLTGPRVGAGLRRGRVELDLTVGPALWVLGANAHVKDGTHTFVAFAVTAGGRLSVTLVPALALHLGVDVAAALTEAQVTAADRVLADFSAGSLELTLGLAYHR